MAIKYKRVVLKLSGEALAGVVLKADAFNNLSGVISTFLLIVGIHIASDEGYPIYPNNQHSDFKIQS